jgi:hypothetical protein
VDVHIHQSGHQVFTLSVNARRALGYFYLFGRSDFDNAPIAHDNGLPLQNTL